MDVSAESDPCAVETLRPWPPSHSVRSTTSSTGPAAHQDHSVTKITSYMRGDSPCVDDTCWAVMPPIMVEDLSIAQLRLAAGGARCSVGSRSPGAGPSGSRRSARKAGGPARGIHPLQISRRSSNYSRVPARGLTAQTPEGATCMLGGTTASQPWRTWLAFMFLTISALKNLIAPTGRWSWGR